MRLWRLSNVWSETLFANALNPRLFEDAAGFFFEDSRVIINMVAPWGTRHVAFRGLRTDSPHLVTDQPGDYERVICDVFVSCAFAATG